MPFLLKPTLKKSPQHLLEAILTTFGLPLTGWVELVNCFRNYDRMCFQSFPNLPFQLLQLLTFPVYSCCSRFVFVSATIPCRSFLGKIASDPLLSCAPATSSPVKVREREKRTWLPQSRFSWLFAVYKNGVKDRFGSRQNGRSGLQYTQHVLHLSACYWESLPASQFNLVVQIDFDRSMVRNGVMACCNTCYLAFKRRWSIL